MSKAILMSEIVESNGKTVYENNMAKDHELSLGQLVELDVEVYNTHRDAQVSLKGRCRLYIVGHTRDCDGTPLYIFSNIPAKYTGHPDATTKALYHSLSVHIERNRSYEKDNMVIIGEPIKLYKSFNDWLIKESP